MRYRVVAPYVTVRTREAVAAHISGWSIGIQGYSRHAILPEDVPAEAIEHLLRDKLIEPVGE